VNLVVYILKSTLNEGLYVGQTSDLSRRLQQHNDPASQSYTSKRGPWVVVHSEPLPNRLAAMARERFLKSIAGLGEMRRLAGVS
jgi:predicted GIY-YIG superfamily endonuclease